MTVMESKKQPPKYTAEFRERGVRLYREQRPDYTSDNAAYRAIASKLGCSHDTLRAWCIQAARDAGDRRPARKSAPIMHDNCALRRRVRLPVIHFVTFSFATRCNGSSSFAGTPIGSIDARGS